MLAATLSIFSRTRTAVFSIESVAQSSRLKPSVTVRMSRCSISVMRTVCRISAWEYSMIISYRIAETQRRKRYEVPYLCFWFLRASVSLWLTYPITLLSSSSTRKTMKIPIATSTKRRLGSYVASPRTTEETWRIFSTRLTLSASAPRVAVEARCRLSRALPYVPAFVTGSAGGSNFLPESWAVTFATAGAPASAATCGSGSGAGRESGLPQSGQNMAGSRMDAPQEAQRCEISGCDINFKFRISNCELLNCYCQPDCVQAKNAHKFAVRNSHF